MPGFSPVKFLPLVALFTANVVVSAQGRLFAIQLEAFTSQEPAAKRMKELQAEGIDAYLVRSEVPGKGVFYRVRVGRFSTSIAARRLGEDLRGRQLTADFFVASWEPPFSVSGNAARTPTLPLNAVAAPSAGPPSAGTSEPSPTVPTTPALQRDGLKAQKSVEPPRSAVKAPPTFEAKSRGEAKPTPALPSSDPRATPAHGPDRGISRSFIRFSDQSVGYAFDRPITWEGGLLATPSASDQQINAGALFRSTPDRAFLNVIWNRMDNANSADHDNDLIVELILQSMSSGEGTKQMKEVARRVVTEKGQIKTYLDLQAKFVLPGGTSILDFSGKGVIARNSQGVLLVVTFYSNSGPTDLPEVADRILASVTLP
ncbi:MAG: hypothetical protein EBU88_02800 [Acidobacteria bacterium]|nr:hypothetical protein [Acidobacteriota bacterium]